MPKLTPDQVAAELEALADLAKVLGARLDRLFDRAPADILVSLDAAAPLTFDATAFAAASHGIVALIDADVERAA
jgi:hypothetical protein